MTTEATHLSPLPSGPRKWRSLIDLVPERQKPLTATNLLTTRWPPRKE